MYKEISIISTKVLLSIESLIEIINNILYRVREGGIRSLFIVSNRGSYRMNFTKGGFYGKIDKKKVHMWEYSAS